MLVVLLACGCVRLETNVRTERGPVVRTSERQSTLEGGVTAALTVAWPTVTVALSGYDTCRTEVVDEAIEETITERGTRAAGPALSTGIANVLASGVLFLTSLAVSGEPNVAVIDERGRYGASTRQYMQGAGWVTLGIGVPALAVGIVSLIVNRDDIQARPVQTVVSQREQRCGARPLTAPVVVETVRGPLGPLVARDGHVTIDVGALSGAMTRMTVFGRTVEIDEASQPVLEALNACLELPPPADDVRRDAAALTMLAQQLRECRPVHPQVAARIEAVDAALAVREGMVEEAAVTDAEAVSTFDEALQRYAPIATWDRAGGLDVPVGSPVRVVGVVTRFASGVCLLEAGGRRVEVPLAGQPWSAVATVGRRVEVVGLVAGAGEGGAPWVLHPVFMRAGF